MATNQIQQFGLNSYGYAKFQRHPPNGFWEEEFLIYFSKIQPFGCYGNQSKSAI